MAEAARAPGAPGAVDSTLVPDELRTADQLGLQLVRLLRLSNHAKQHFTARTGHGIERSNYALLATLIHVGPLRANALAEAIHSDPSTVSRQVGTLVGQGLVQRRIDPGDGRACVLAPTDEGIRVFKANHEQRTRQIRRMLEDWPDDEQATLVRLLTKLNTEIEKFQGDNP